MKLLAKRDKVYLIEDKGKIRTIINDKYTEIKLEQFDGNRIFYDFGDGLKVQETYDERIFNCYKNDVVINIRNGNKIAEFIADNNKTGYAEYFNTHYYQQHKSEFLDKIVGSYGDRVIKVNDGFIVDGVWKVNNQGTSYYHTTGHTGKFDNYVGRQVHNDTVEDVGTDWHFLCTVAQGRFMKMSIDTDIGELVLDETTTTIMAKINFLMNPNINDSIFMNQLPDKLRKLLKDEAESNKDTGVLI